MRTLSGTLATGLAIVATLGTASGAAADPKGPFIAVACDNGHSYVITLNGNGVFSPGHDVSSTTILVPTSFGEFHAVVTDASGDVVDDHVDPPAAKGSSGHARATTTHCTFSIDATIDDPDLGPLTITGKGSLVGFVTPVR